MSSKGIVLETSSLSKDDQTHLLKDLQLYKNKQKIKRTFSLVVPLGEGKREKNIKFKENN